MREGRIEEPVDVQVLLNQVVGAFIVLATADLGGPESATSRMEEGNASKNEHQLGHFRQLFLGLPVPLPLITGIAVPDQAHASNVGAIQDGTHASLVATVIFIFGSIVYSLFIFQAAMEDEVG